jgi:hypothetical protein
MTGDIMKCHMCGIDKDPAILEKYPFADEDGIIEDPIEPLFDIDCQPGGPGGMNLRPWKKITLCHSCWHRLKPDMWTCQEHYEARNPVTPYNELPDLPENEI